MQAKAWQKAGARPIGVSVNVSARQFAERNWVGRVSEILAESGLEPNRLELELTESLIIKDVPLAIATMRQLRTMGVQLSIDDFGMGYSSLNALKSFPVARLKLDQSFVREIPNNRSDNAIAITVISLGHELNLKVIAEGVENVFTIALPARAWLRRGARAITSASPCGRRRSRRCCARRICSAPFPSPCFRAAEGGLLSLAPMHGRRRWRGSTIGGHAGVST